MNKKFTSAILLGALLAASAGSFMSCKDYDDDIDAINEELAQVKSKVSAIEAEIEKGEWVASVTSVSNGFTVTFSNGQSYTITNGKDGANGTNGKDGADGANGIDGKNGTNGTAWTISEDGYWVCDDVKTTVKAVGVDGTKAQQEVKKENSVWYLWNGTEYETFTSAFDRAEAVPYYYIDPNDQNYAVLVVTDVDGNNKEQIRLPLNEGLAQMKFLKELSGLTVYYTKATKDIEWEGPKGNVAKDSYFMTQDAGSILVQVTPSNYDLAAINDFSMVNSKNEVAPIAVGAPVAYEKLTTKSVSKSGLFELPIEVTTLDKDLVELYGSNKVALSLKANEKVRSGYEYTFTLKASSGITIDDNSIKFGQVDAKATKSDGKVEPVYTVEAGDSIMFGAIEGAEYVYDAYLTTGEMSQADKINYEAWGITIDKKAMKIKCNDKANGTLPFKIVYLNVKGDRKDITFTVDFTKTTVRTFDNLFDKAIEHKANADNQFIVADLSKYFSGMSADERTYWNKNVNDVGDSVVWVKNDGTKKTLGFKKVFPKFSLLDKDGKRINWVTGKYDESYSQVAKTKFVFQKDYKDLELDNGKFTIYLSFKNGSNRGSVDVIEIPFTVTGPTADDIKKLYSFNTSYAKNDTITVIDEGTTKRGVTLPTDADETIYIYGSDKQTAASLDLSKAEWNGVKYSTSNKFAVSKAEDYGKAYQITGAKLNYIGRTWDITNLYLKFIKIEDYIIVTNFTEKPSIVSGSASELKLVYDRTGKVPNGWYTKKYKDGTIQDPESVWVSFYNESTNFDKVTRYATSIAVECSSDLITASCETYKDYTGDFNNWPSVAQSTLDEDFGTITIKSTGKVISNDTDVTVTIKYGHINNNGADYPTGNLSEVYATKDIVVTVKGVN